MEKKKPRKTRSDKQFDCEMEHIQFYCPKESVCKLRNLYYKQFKPLMDKKGNIEGNYKLIKIDE